MQFSSLLAALVATAAMALPQGSTNDRPVQYTLTAHSPSVECLNGLKVNWGGALNLFQAEVSSYCPFTGDQASYCPNGTETVFVGTLYPSSMVPGGQDLYVREDGFVTITVQHSHSIPPTAYAYGIGWTWIDLPSDLPPIQDCPADNLHNCEAPRGYFTFRAPNATVGGVVACTGPFGATSIYAVTPNFNETGCRELTGLGTHEYTGPSPPVWAY